MNVGKRSDHWNDDDSGYDNWTDSNFSVRG